MSTPTSTIPYDPNFLGDGLAVPLPALRGAAMANSLREGEVFDYTYYSVAMNRIRKLAVYSAANVDGARWVSLSRPGGWSTDDRVGAENQLTDRFYSPTWTRGHLTRRADVCWGDKETARKANRNTFFLANAAPQHAGFNGDEWGELEDWFLDNATSEHARATVITGPIFREDDPRFTSDGVTAQVPAGFWKIIAIRDPAAVGADLTASAFVMRQSDMWNDTTGARLNRLERYQVPIMLVERLTCLDFGALRTVDPLGWKLDRASLPGAELRRIRVLDDVVISSAERRRSGVRYPRSESCACAPEAPCGAAPAGEVNAALLTRIERLEGLLAGVQESLAELGGQLPESERAAVVRARAELVVRILGGVPVTNEEFGDCVFLDVGNYMCTGVLVGPNVVLTAAHCTFDQRGRPIRILRAFVGNNTRDADASTEWINVKSQKAHEDYNPGGGYRAPSHDIALVVLERDVRKASPVRVATPRLAQESGSVTMVGFGATDRNASRGMGQKRKVTLPDVRFYLDESDADMSYEAELHDYDLGTEFSAVDPKAKKDSCNGDSGGPAYVLGEQDGHLLVGLTSRAVAGARYYCGEGGVYTLVQPHWGWVTKTATALGGRLAGPPLDSGESGLTEVEAGAHGGVHSLGGGTTEGGTTDDGTTDAGTTDVGSGGFEPGCC